MLAVYCIEVGLLVLLSAFLIFYYAYPKAALYAKVLVFFSFLVSLLCFLILPLDIYESSLDSRSSTPCFSASSALCWSRTDFAVCVNRP